MAKLEIACFNRTSARIAQECGADRIELCAEMEVGGTTPLLTETALARKDVRIDLHVMIRPRGGSFAYSDAEFEQMKVDISRMKELGVDGLVFGILNSDNSVNTEQNAELVALASPLSCTFHRAFDQANNMDAALEDVISCGFKTILTSGGEANVIKGLSNLERLIQAAGERIVIMPGGGLRSANVAEVLQQTGAAYVHSSAITDGSDTAVAEEVMALKEKCSALLGDRLNNR